MKKNDQFVSTAQVVLRGWLIEHFVNEQKITHGYLLLTADRLISHRVPASIIVAEQWAWLRQKTGTIPEEVQKAEIDLMYAVSASKFPELLMLCRTTGVELLSCFDRSLVEEMAAKIGRKLEIEFDPWEAETKNAKPGEVVLNTAVMTHEKCSSLNLWNNNSSGNGLVEPYRGLLWAPREAIVAFLAGRGVDPFALPSAWLGPVPLSPTGPGEELEWRPYPPVEDLGPVPAFVQQLLRQAPKFASAWPASWTEGELLKVAEAQFARLPSERRPKNVHGKVVKEVNLDAVKRAVGLKI